MQWWFERENPMGGASSGAFRNPLAGAGVPAVDTFVREVVQNSVDAALAADSVVRIRIRSDRIEGEDLSRWRSLLGLETDSDILARSGLLPAQQLAEQLVGSLEVLVVEDFETAGLGGTVDPIASTDEDNFRRLCHKVGSTREGEGLGGSFGFGKATYWAASSIWTVVFYSRFEPTGRTGDDWARFVGVSWFKEHTGPGGEGAEDVEFTGRAFFGAPGHYDSQPVSRPIINDHAQRLAEQLGLHVRGENETGTTAVILGNQLDLDGVTEGIERHWWPRILAGRLDVEVLGERPPQPLSRPDLRPFVRAWEILFGEEPQDHEDHSQLVYNRRPLGDLALVLDDDSGDESTSKIALVRGPGMVVEYHERPRAGPSQPTCSGVLRAADEMEESLRASEPPAHDRWDDKTTRTDRPLSTDERVRIKKLFDKIRAGVREFTRQHREPPPEAPPRCRMLEKALGELFSTEPSGPRPAPQQDKDPFSVRFVETPVRLLDGENAVIDATVEVALSEEGFAGDTEVVCTMMASLDLIHDEGSVSQKLPMSYMNAKDPKDGEEILGSSAGGKTSLEALFVQDEGPWRIELRTEPLPHPEYRARLNFEVERVP